MEMEHVQGLGTTNLYATNTKVVGHGSEVREGMASGHGKHMNNKQNMDTHGSGACTRLRHHQLVCSQYRSGGSWVRGKKGYGLVVGRRGKPILEFPLKLFWGKCLARMTYHPKEGKMSWNH